jgi:hypothetical protein
MSEAERKSGLAKTGAFFAVGFGVSLGLCGANYVADQLATGDRIGQFLMNTGIIELAGMVVFGAGLVVVGMFAICRLIYRALTDNGPGDS